MDWTTLYICYIESLEPAVKMINVYSIWTMKIVRDLYLQIAVDHRNLSPPLPRTTPIVLGRKIGDTSSNPPHSKKLNLHIFIWVGGGGERGVNRWEQKWYL